MNILIAAMAAVAIQPLVFLLRIAPDLLASNQPFYGMGLVLVAVAVVSTVVVLVLGVPSFLALRKFRRESYCSLAMAGSLLGALPNAIFWPRELEGYSAGHNWHGTYVETYVNGIPTVYAWLNYTEGVAFFSLHGLAGALVFYVVWSWRQRSNTSFKPTPSGAA